MRGKLKKLVIKSKLPRVRIKYNGETISFNLYDELAIDSNTFIRELTEQPQLYGFLSIVCTKLGKVKDDLEIRKDKIYGRIFYQAKAEQQVNGRPINDEMAKAFTMESDEYTQAAEEFNQAKEDYLTLLSCTRSFEQRASTLQSINSRTKNN